MTLIGQMTSNKMHKLFTLLISLRYGQKLSWPFWSLIIYCELQLLSIFYNSTIRVTFQFLYFESLVSMQQSIHTLFFSYDWIIPIKKNLLPTETIILNHSTHWCTSYPQWCMNNALFTTHTHSLIAFCHQVE